MSTDNSPESGSSSSSDEPAFNLELVLLGYVDRINRGGRVDPEEVYADHPDVAAEILEQIEAFRGIDREFHPDPPLGTLGDYTLRRQIGRGGMGVVYEAWENSMDRPVALKVLPVGVAADDRSLHRFVREAKTAGKLSHPNVVSVYGMGLKEQTPYYAMELVEGETLAQILTRVNEQEPGTETPFGPKDDADYFVRVARAFADVAEGLQHAHAKGVIHRDIKPSNLIFDAEGHLRILDFGLAHLEGQESLTRSGDLMGTVLYMSPEQAMAKRIPLDHRTDVYSLGATMYEVLAGEPPFRGKDQHDTLSQIIVRDARPPRRLNPRVPTDLETVVLKCLRKDPGDRYGTAEALAQDLRRFVRGDPIEARPQPSWERIARRLKRQRVKLLVASVFLILTSVAGWLALERQRQAEETNRLIDENHLVSYDIGLRNAVLKIAAGQLSVQAGALHSKQVGRSDLGQSTDLFRAEDFRRLVGIDAHALLRQAVRELEDVIRTVPRKHEGYFHLGRAYLLLGRKKKAGRAISEALTYKPDFLPARLLQLELHATTPEEAREEFDRILSRYEKAGGWEKWWLLAHRSVYEKNWPETARAYAELGEYEPEPYMGSSIDASMGEGLALVRDKDYLGAVLPFARAGVDRSELALWITVAYDSRNDCERALEYARQVGDQELNARLQLYLLSRLRRTGDAIALGRKVAGNSRDPIAHYLFGLALFEDLVRRPRGERQKKLDEVIAVLTRALKLKADFRAARELLDAAERERTRIMKRPKKTWIALTLVAGLGTSQAQEGFFDEPVKVTNNGYNELAPYVTADRLKMYFASRRPEGAGGLDLYVATRANVDELFGDDVRYLDELNTEHNEGPPELSADELTIYFNSNRSGMAGFYRATRDDPEGRFGPPEELLELRSPSGAFSPTLTRDELTIVFASRQEGGAGAVDLWIATREDVHQDFGTPTPLAGVNTPSSEAYPSISADGLTLFWSNHVDGFNPDNSLGFSDIWVATRSSRDEDFGNVQNLGPPVNTGRRELSPHISHDWPHAGAILYFAGCEVFDPDCRVEGMDIYQSVWHPDCNGNGEDDVEEIANGDAGDINANDIPDECEPKIVTFLRGDSNTDGQVNITDGVSTLGFLFDGDQTLPCLDAADADDSGELNVADSITTFNWLFAGGATPAPPGPQDCGDDPTPNDDLDCAAFAACPP